MYLIQMWKSLMNNCFVYGFFDPRENFKEFFYIGKGK